MCVCVCVSLLSTPAVLPGERLKDGGGRLGAGGWELEAGRQRS